LRFLIRWRIATRCRPSVCTGCRSGIVFSRDFTFVCDSSPIVTRSVPAPFRALPAAARKGAAGGGLSVFDLLRYRQHDRAAVLWAFDLIELDGEDMRRSPLELAKRALAELLRKKSDGIVLNVHYGGDGAAIYKAACTLG
jgi:hypothetical protein